MLNKHLSFNPEASGARTNPSFIANFSFTAMLYINYNFSVNSRLLNSSRRLILGLSLQICKASIVSSFRLLAVYPIISDFSSAVPPTSLLHSKKCCPAGESPLRCSSTLFIESNDCADFINQESQQLRLQPFPVLKSLLF